MKEVAFGSEVIHSRDGKYVMHLSFDRGNLMLLCSHVKESHFFSVVLDWTSHKESHVTW